MREKEIKNCFRKPNGITLIALVITIIVLLILAGVVISQIMGQDSAPDKAVEGKLENEKGSARDAATLLVSEKIEGYYEAKYVSRSTQAETTLAYLEEELSSSKSVTTGEGYKIVVADGKITVTKTGESTAFVSGTVASDGVITWDGISSGPVIPPTGTTNITENGETITLTKANAKDYYGKTVATINGIEYGLFYVDFDGTYSGGEKGTIYLRAKSSIEYTTLNNPSLSSEALTIMQQLNPQWNAARGTTEIENLTSAEKGAEHLCNPAVSTWSSLQTEFEEKYNTPTKDDNVNYVIGGPSIELFLASYNANYNSEYSANFNLNKELDSSCTKPGYLYSNGTGYTTYYYSAIPSANAGEGMYVNTGRSEWLASPQSAGWDYYVCIVDYNGGLGFEYWDRSWCVAPLVSLKPGVNLTVE